MGTNSEIKRLQLKQLDKRCGRLQKILELSSMREGWIKQIREALGMSARQLATKVGISQPTLAKIEKSETERTVSLKTLDKIAEALECKVIYAFVPRDSFRKIVYRRALAASEKLVRRVSHSMDLEKQGISSKERQAQIQEIADELARNLSRDLWENWK